jgi:hypothetical protein
MATVACSYLGNAVPTGVLSPDFQYNKFQWGDDGVKDDDAGF